MPIELSCGWCGKGYRVPPSRANLETVSGLHFCSKPCHFAWRTKNFRQSEQMKRRLSPRVSGSNNPQWKGDGAKAAAGRKRARGMFPDLQPCEACGSRETERHHRDGNRLNNSKNNIAFLCRKHHIEADRARGEHGRFIRKEESHVPD